MFHSETLPTEQCQSNSLVNATQKHPINNYQSISKSLEVIRREIDNPHSISWRTIIIQNTMENGEGERDEISRFLKKKKVQKMIALLF